MMIHVIKAGSGKRNPTELVCTELKPEETSAALSAF